MMECACASAQVPQTRAARAAQRRHPAVAGAAARAAVVPAGAAHQKCRVVRGQPFPTWVLDPKRWHGSGSYPRFMNGQAARLAGRNCFSCTMSVHAWHSFWLAVPDRFAAAGTVTLYFVHYSPDAQIVQHRPVWPLFVQHRRSHTTAHFCTAILHFMMNKAACAWLSPACACVLS